MNIIELEEGLRNLIATQPAVLSGANGKVISGIKNIIESHKAFAFRIEEYPENDILKIGLTNESSKLELNLVSYVCQVLQERGINIMLYVPRYAAVYSQEIVKYVDEVLPDKEESDESEEDELLQEEPEEKLDLSKIEKYLVVEDNKPLGEANVQPKTEQKVEKKPVQKLKSEQIQSKTKGRDYLMELLKK